MQTSLDQPKKKTVQYITSKYDSFAAFTTENIVKRPHDKFLEIGRLSKGVRVQKKICQFLTAIQEED